MKFGTWILALIVAGITGWFVGHHVTASRAGGIDVDESGESLQSENATLRAENERLRTALSGVAPTLEGTIDSQREAGAASKEPTLTNTNTTNVEFAKLEPLEEFELSNITSAEEFANHMLRYVHTQLGKGKEGHLALLRLLGTMGTKEFKEKMGPLFEQEGRRAVKHLYPMIKYAVEHDQEVAALTETFFEVAAENPEFFEGLDDDPFEIFTEGIGMLMPAVTSQARIDRMRGYAMAILQRPKDQLPKALERNRRDIERLVAIWAPPLSVDDALAKLKSGEVNPEELMLLLPQIPKEAWAVIDVAPLVGPMLVKSDWNAVQILRRIPAISPGTVASLDNQIFAGLGEGKTIQPWILQRYLQVTKGSEFDDVKPFLERGLTLNRAAGDATARLLMNYRGTADGEWVAWVMGRADVDDALRRQVLLRFGLQDK